jgi:hypothetical protein
VKRRRRGGLGSSAAAHSQRRDRHVESGIARAQSGLLAAQEGRCAVAYEALKQARWDNGAAWAHRDAGGAGRAGGATLTQFDQALQHADDTFRNRCFPRR